MRNELPHKTIVFEVVRVYHIMNINKQDRRPFPIVGAGFTRPAIYRTDARPRDKLPGG